MPAQLQLLLISVGLFVFIVGGILVMIARFYRKVDQGKALIINKMKDRPEVTFTGGVVFPIFHRAEVMDISVKTIEIDRRGGEGLICKDNIRADIKVTFYVRVNQTVDDVLKVAQAVGCQRASDLGTLDELFNAKFSEALKSVGKNLEFEELYTKREEFRDRIVSIIGTDLNGYALEDAAIDYLEQTPIEALDAQNILDAQGIRKITDITAQANVSTNQLKQKQRMEIGSQNLAADEAVFRFDQQRAEAEAKKQKEIDIAKSREENEAERVRIQEQLRTKLEQEKAYEQAQVAEQNRARAVVVAEQARLREQAVEEVRVNKARELEDIGRERETQIRNIEREEELEIRKKKIADVIRDRIAVERTVAEEEENIKDLRAQKGAKREKEVKIIGAEADAQQVLVKEIKQAEASEEVAKFEARRRLTLAEAELEASDREARAKIRMSDGVQAEAAAAGLAAVKVKEAEADAIEKQGLAKVRVRDADLNVTEREGAINANIVRQKESATAAGVAEMGIANAKSKEADAAATEKMGQAEAVATRERLLAEAAGKEAEAVAIEKLMGAEARGLLEKAEAMKKLDGVGREHEEFRLQLATQKEIALGTLDARVNMAEKQAAILVKAFENANINIVGGDGQFFERFISAVSVGQSIDGAIGNSKALQHALGDYLEGDGNIVRDLKGVLGTGASGTIKDLTLSALIGRLMTGADDDKRQKLQALIDEAQRLGVDQLSK